MLQYFQPYIQSKKGITANAARQRNHELNKTACPDLTVGENGVSISTEDCNGCTICQQICPFGAIEKEGE